MRGNYQLMEISILIVELAAMLVGFAFLVLLFLVYIDIDQKDTQDNDVRRWCDVHSIEKALTLYQAEHEGSFPVGVDYELRMLGLAKTGCDVVCGPEQLVTEVNCLDISHRISPDYLTELPLDPGVGSKLRSFYGVKRLGENGIYVTACNIEQVEDLCIGQ